MLPFEKGNQALKMPTIRQKIIDLLSQSEMEAHEVSRSLGIPEREVYAHLSHIARSVAAQHKTLAIRPPRCLQCGYVFKDRKRFSRPSRCPRCKKSHLQNPGFHISSAFR
jgi:predicted Zn-ribbon and HTH transcriptional regulator